MVGLLGNGGRTKFERRDRTDRLRGGGGHAANSHDALGHLINMLFHGPLDGIQKLMSPVASSCSPIWHRQSLWPTRRDGSIRVIEQQIGPGERSLRDVLVNEGRRETDNADVTDKAPAAVTARLCLPILEEASIDNLAANRRLHPVVDGKDPERQEKRSECNH